LHLNGKIENGVMIEKLKNEDPTQAALSIPEEFVNTTELQAGLLT
jgi:hypothetical protein